MDICVVIFKQTVAQDSKVQEDTSGELTSGHMIVLIT